MKISPVDFRLTLSHDNTRSGGVHASDIVRDIGFTMGYIPPQYEHSEMNAERVSLGNAWEDWVFPKQHPEIAYHPGEVLIGGVLPGTCDGLSWLEKENNKLIVHECKLTWKSMKKALTLENEWLWLAQTMLYCNGWGTNRARYHIYWVNGDYNRGSDSGGPQYKLYDLEFTARELRDNATMILNRGKEKHGLVTL